MKNAKKMLLVDLDEYNKLIKLQHGQSDILNDLNREMKSILEDKRHDDREKIFLYNRMLQRYTMLKEADDSKNKQVFGEQMNKFLNKSGQHFASSSNSAPAPAPLSSTFVEGFKDYKFNQFDTPQVGNLLLQANPQFEDSAVVDLNRKRLNFSGINSNSPNDLNQMAFASSASPSTPENATKRPNESLRIARGRTRDDDDDELISSRTRKQSRNKNQTGRGIKAWSALM